jgi:hypothetical protein
VLHAFGLPPFAALRLVSWLVLTAAAVFLFRVAQIRHDDGTARWALVLFLSSPLVLFWGMTVGTFGDEALVASLTAFFCLRALRRHAGGMRLESYLVGLLGGLQPTTLVFSLPLLLWTGKKLELTGRAAAGAALAWLLGSLCWLVPQADLAGGFDDYLAANVQLLRPLLQTSPLAKGPLAFLASLGTPLTALLFGLGAARWVTTLLVAPSAPSRFERGFVLAWVLPVVLLGILLGFRDTGAMLALWPLLCLVMASRWSLAAQRRRWRPTLLLLFLALDVAGYFWGHAPQSAAPPRGADVASSAGPWRRELALLLTRVDFFYERTRQASFDAFLHRLEGWPFPDDETLLLGGTATRAACVRFPMRRIIQVDPLRPWPFLRYEGLRATPLDSTEVVPSQVTWLLLEAEAGELVFSPPDTETQRPIRPLRLDRHLLAFPVGSQRLDAWFLARRAGGGETPRRLHLWREGLLDDPDLFDRAAISP